MYQNESVYDFNLKFSKLHNKVPHGSKLSNPAVLSIHMKAFDPKTGYELRNRCPTTLAKAHKIALTIENNRKAAGMVSKRDNPRNPQNPSVQQTKLEGQHRHERPRLHDMPYNTNWKDGRPIDNSRKQHYGKDTPDPLKRNMAHMVENKPWCLACNLPHLPEYCEVAKSVQQEEMLYS